MPITMRPFEMSCIVAYQLAVIVGSRIPGFVTKWPSLILLVCAAAIGERRVRRPARGCASRRSSRTRSRAARPVLDQLDDPRVRRVRQDGDAEAEHVLLLPGRWQGNEHIAPKSARTVTCAVPRARVRRRLRTARCSSGLNARLATFVGGPIRASIDLVSRSGRSCCSCSRCSSPGALIDTSRLGHVPWWVWLGGALGAGLRRVGSIVGRAAARRAEPVRGGHLGQLLCSVAARPLRRASSSEHGMSAGRIAGVVAASPPASRSCGSSSRRRRGRSSCRQPVERLHRELEVLVLRVLELRVREAAQALDEDHHRRHAGARDLGRVVQRPARQPVRRRPRPRGSTRRRARSAPRRTGSARCSRSAPTRPRCPPPARTARDARLGVAEHLRELVRVEVALVEQALGRLDDRGDDARAS